MIASKIINNNAVYSHDENGEEVIVVGKGIGFGKKAGQKIDDNRIEKIFRFSPKEFNQFAQLVNEIPFENIQLAEEIVDYAYNTLGRDLNKNVYITVTDHLNYAIERKKMGVHFENALLWEIKKFYKEEFEIGLHALDLVKERTGVELPNDEAGYIALHIVNAEMNGDITKVGSIPEIIKGLLDIVRTTFKIEFDEDSLSYERFVTHLKFLLQRTIQKECYTNEDEEYAQMFFLRYPKSYRCTKKMMKYLREQMGTYEESGEELMYLTVHIQRVVQSRKETEQ